MKPFFVSDVLVSALSKIKLVLQLSICATIRLRSSLIDQK